MFNSYTTVFRGEPGLTSLFDGKEIGAMDSIDRFDGDYRWLSNFWPCQIDFEGQTFDNVESAYCAAKCENPLDRLQFLGISGGRAKRLGRTVQLRSDWSDPWRLEIMENLLRQKFCDPSLEQLLRKTASLQIVEGNTWGDTFWGVCDGVGENNLGKLLMKIRDER